MRRLLPTLLLVLLLLPAAASAQQPVTPLGPQLRLTAVGADGDKDSDASDTDVAYDSRRDEYLIVWENSVPIRRVPKVDLDTEIFAQRLAADGTRIGAPFQVSGLAGSVADVDAADPAVAYSEELDRYAVVFQREIQFLGAEIQLQQVSGDGTLIRSDGTPGVEARLASGSSLPAAEPDVTYRPDASGDGSPGDRWIVASSGDTPPAPGEHEIFLGTLDPRSAAASLQIQVSNLAGATADASAPVVTALPGVDDVVVAFEGNTGTDTEIFARRVSSGGGAPGQLPVSETAGSFGVARAPAIAVNPNAGQLLVAFVNQGGEGPEIAVQRLDFGLGQLGGTVDQAVSSAGPPGTGFAFIVSSPAIAYSPALRRYLVAWEGQDDGRSGLSAEEHEVQATTLDATGAEGAPQDFVVSRAGLDGDADGGVGDTALAANLRSGRWLSVWSADDPPALADGEFELFARQVGENFDLDADGSPVPADCDDRNAGRRPGAPDVPDNGLDEDCSGADAVNLDRDGDGSQRPADCNDADPAIAPSKRDIPNNDIDEDCANGARRVRTRADVDRGFRVFRDFTKVTKLRVTQTGPGMKVRIRCAPARGKGCPRPLRGNGRSATIKRPGAKDLTPLVKDARLEPGATLEVRVLEPGAIGRLDRFVMRDAKLPERVKRCIPFGTTKPQKRCAGA